MNKPPKFLISVLCLNRLECTKACLEAVFAGGGDFELIVTDNGSTDGTKEYLEELLRHHQNMTLVRHEENLGFIIPMNDAFAAAVRRDIPYFVALNNDTVPPAGWLDVLSEPLDKIYKAALSGPIGGCNMILDTFHGAHGQFTEYLEGSCLMVKTRTVAMYGPLFSNYLTFAYGEDSDLSLRMLEKGYSIHKVNLEVPHTDRFGTLRNDPELKEASMVHFHRNHEVLRKRWAKYLLKRDFT